MELTIKTTMSCTSINCYAHEALQYRCNRTEDANERQLTELQMQVVDLTLYRTCFDNESTTGVDASVECIITQKLKLIDIHSFQVTSLHM